MNNVIIIVFELVEKISIPFFVLSIAIVVLITFLTSRIFNKKGVNSVQHEVSKYLLIVIICFILQVTIFNRIEEVRTGISIIPFQKIFQNNNIINVKELVYFVFNIVLFIPLGFLIGIIKMRYSLLRIFFLTVSFSFIFTIFIEFAQSIFQLGFFEIDDIIANSLGGAIGYLAFLIFLLLYKLCYIIKRKFYGEKNE